MKLGRNKKDNLNMLSRPAVNQAKKNLLLIVLILITAALIYWVMMMGQKAERTVTVAMLAENVYKNQVITEELLKPYEMLEGEFEKYALINSEGQTKRRILLWSEKDMVINSFAAYPLKKDTYAEYRDFIKSRTDNSDNVLYSFPGKEIVTLSIGQEDMEAFKTFLKPGDRLNVQAVFSERVTVEKDDGYGGTITEQVDTFKTETVFGDIMVADLLNSDGESILDLYASYREMSTWEQAELDKSSNFKERTSPQTLLIALTPEEIERYYYYISKSNVEFNVSMPQRIE
mgnify:CR=1 FL=1